MIVRCPICKKKLSWEGNPFRPFCSERCKLIDLSKWIKGEYSVPVMEDDDRPEDKEEID